MILSRRKSSEIAEAARIADERLILGDERARTDEYGGTPEGQKEIFIQ